MKKHITAIAKQLIEERLDWMGAKIGFTNFVGIIAIAGTVLAGFVYRDWLLASGFSLTCLFSIEARWYLLHEKEFLEKLVEER